MSADSIPPAHPVLLRRIILGIFIVALVVNLWALTRRWDASLRDGHEFRQYQTALTAFYFKKDGLRLDYETPVLGPPWSIPLEFPSYQAVAAKLSNCTGLPLEQAGRLTSIFFFYATLPAVWLLLRRRLPDCFDCLLALTPVLLCPVLMFYSRTFMIESTALCLTVWFLAAFETFLEKPRLPSLTAAWLFGALAITTKITTFAAAWIWATLFVIEKILARRWLEQSWPRRFLPPIALALLAASVPLAAEAAWLQHSNHLKDLHPYGYALTSTAPGFRAFNLGTLAQRLSFEWWSKIGHVTTQLVLVTPGLVILFAGLFVVSAPYRHLALVCAVSYAGGFLLFSNLYYIHDYYFYASVIFLLSAFGVICAGLLRSQRIPRAISITLIIAGLAAQINAFSQTYYSFYRQDNAPIPFEAEIIRRLTPPEDVFAGFGYDWTSLLPYSSQRRAIMPFLSHAKNFEALDASISHLEKRQLTTVVVTGYLRKEYPFIENLRTRLQLTPEPVIITEDADIYVRRDRAAETTKILSSRTDWNDAKLNPQPDAGAMMLLNHYDLRTSNWIGRLSMTSPAPIFSRGPVEIGIQPVGDHLAISTQAPTELHFQPPVGSRSIEAVGGMIPSSYTEGHTTPGIVLTVYEEQSDGSRHLIFERRLDPLNKAEDRGDVVISCQQEKPFTGKLVFAHNAIPSGNVNYSWSYWKRIVIR